MNRDLARKKGRFEAHAYPLLLCLLVLALVAAILASLCAGRYPVALGDVVRILTSTLVPVEPTWARQTESVVLVLRLPRILAAVFVGGALALSGAAYQGVFKKPLVAPDMLGVSSGACIGAALAILTGMGSWGIQAAAFAFGFLAVGTTTLIPRILRSSSMMMLVLSGLIVGGGMSSIMGAIKYLADPETQLASITYWQLGSLAQSTLRDVLLIAPAMLFASAALIGIRWRINVLSMGEQEARTLGMNVSRTRGTIIVCATALTASAVCISGTIGWIGLVIPHLSRLMVGSDNVRMLPVACVLGALFLVAIDTAARVLTHAELPLSILTGLIGAPFYFYLLLRQRMRLS